MYKLMALTGFLIRQFAIVNPFEKLGNIEITSNELITLYLPPVLLNIMVEPIIHLFTFSIVGVFYERGSYPFIGSLLYLIFYIIHTLILMLIVTYHDYPVRIVFIVVSYILLIAFLSSIISRLIPR